LHEWLGEPVSEYPHFDPPGLSGQVFADLMATGAVVVGRKTFDYAGHWGGDHHGVPIFVPTRLAQALPREGLLDQLELHLIPVAHGDGRRLFGADRIEVELTRALDAPGVTHLRYCVMSGTAAG
jgi:dihydrofolate reductase